MPGLTTARDSNDRFPAVDEFVALAREVKVIVGADTQLSYAADWSEYFGYHPQDNSGDVYFHLDPLWASPNIAAIGIDAYFRLSDWREGEHVDAAQAQSIYDIGYLSSNVEGGEGYDFYYASNADRLAQNRTPISDESGKPWVFRYKDIRNFWGHQHFERRGGVELPTPTAWVPESKPIWFLEVGCPAVAMGANEPNVFFDPKSDEGKLPLFSTGERDDLIQRNYLLALLGYYARPENNPVSGLDGKSMVDVDLMSVWAWDARPYPDFPARTDVWSDGPNWSRGHWLNGRVGLVSLGDVAKDIAERAGLDNVDATGVRGILQGFHLDQPMSARQALSPLIASYGLLLSEQDGQVYLRSPNYVRHHVFSLSQIVDAPVSAVEYRRDDPNNALKDVRVHFIDGSRDHLLGSESARDLAAQTVRVKDVRVPIVMDPSFARFMAERMLEAHAHSVLTAAVSVRPDLAVDLQPGDTVSLPSGEQLWQIETIEVGNVARLSLRSVPIEFRLPVSGGAPMVSQTVPWRGRASAYAFDLPGYEKGPQVGVVMKPFSATEINHTSASVSLDDRIFIGALLSPLRKGPLGVWDRAANFNIYMPDLQVSAKSIEAVLGGDNHFAIETPTGWEIVAVQNLTLTGNFTYSGNIMLRGLNGTDENMVDLLAAGARILYLGRGLQSLGLADDFIGEELMLTPQSAGKAGDDATLIYGAAHLRPLSPVHLRLDQQDGLSRLSWVRRGRVDADRWVGRDIPLGETAELYRVIFFAGDDVLIEEERLEPFIAFNSAGIERIQVMQVSEIYGPGAAAEIWL